SDRVCIMMTPRGVADVVVYTPDRIRERYGIGPELIPDFIGLKGDTSDNIKGVPGIGEKTAADLLVQFGSLEGVYEHLDDVSGEKRRESLRAAAEDAEKSKVLATIDRSLEVDIDLTSLANESPDRSTMKELFRQLEFRALLKRVDELEEAVPGAAPVISERAEVEWREAALDDLQALPDEVALAIGGDRAAVTGDGGDVLVVDAAAARVVEALRGRRVITHGLKHPALTPAGDTA